ncbi:anti-sigma factor family protein [Streptomyces sp. HUAS TT20]|uniref:anti-sigma factor family protein n=1 Tax=Streptomyces sp. HUAS TT20 TaxID=3447509 RepID=UPI0021D8D068|nr:zf-HC2 domain-containing protein [Streptomyces sp. HUAS 15-9]UXY28670.1 zf-HC2 domain-containing protein [Streptomyces sp. HUAS 15-9]
MTSTTDTTGHPDVAEISDLTEGLLPPTRTADVRRHLDECELCTDVFTSLEEIRGLLGTLPGPVRMPDDVAGRIDAALAAEALLQATAAGSADTPVLVSASPELSDEDAEAPVSRETSAPVDRPAGRPHAATGPGRKDRGRGRRRRTVVLGAVFTAALLGAGSLFLESLGNDQPTTAAHDAFSSGSLKGQVTDLLTTKKGLPHGSGSQKPRLGIQSETETPGSTAKTLIQPQIPVPGCVRQGINNTGAVLGAQKGTYEGTDAYLVILPDAGDNTRVTAYVVDATCMKMSKEAATPGKVLLTQSFARP